MDFKDILNNDTYITEFPDGLTVVWRLLSVSEYKKVYKLLQSKVFTLEQIKAQLAKSHSDLSSRNNLKAGVLSTIGGLILWLSGDSNRETLVNDIFRIRNDFANESIYLRFIEVITLAFPSFSIRELEAMDKFTLIKYFVMAENKLQAINQNYKPLDLSQITFN